MAPADGFTGDVLFNQGEQFDLLYVNNCSQSALYSVGFCYTYDDVIFHPGFIDFSADQACLLDYTLQT